MKLLLGLWFGVFFWSIQVFANVEQAKNNLLALQHRPTMHEFFQAFEDLPKTNPFKKLIDDPYFSRLDSAATFIVELEYVYPGATWALLGRDSSLSADILESFYIANGQVDRVLRLNASGPSFNGGFQKQFLYTAGLTDLNGYPHKKFMILDATSWSGSSQTKRLINAIYSSLPSTNVQAFLPFVNAVNIACSNYAGVGVEIFPTTNPFKFWYESIVSLNAPTSVLHAHGYTYLASYGGEEVVWHGKFLPFVKESEKSDRVFAPIGPISPEAFREHVLWWMYEVWSYVSTHDFKKKVDSIARDQFGFQFDRHMSTYRASLPESVEVWLNENKDHPHQGNNYFTHLYATVLNQFSKNIHQPIAVKNEPALVENITRRFGEQAVATLLPHVKLLSNTSTAAEYLELALRKAQNNKELIRDSVDHFLSLNPSIAQINELIGMFNKNGTTHQLIAGKALAKINNLLDYRTLKKPWVYRRNRQYKSNKAAFKRAHPGFFVEKSRFNFSW